MPTIAGCQAYANFDILRVAFLFLGSISGDVRSFEEVAGSSLDMAEWPSDGGEVGSGSMCDMQWLGLHSPT